MFKILEKIDLNQFYQIESYAKIGTALIQSGGISCKILSAEILAIRLKCRGSQSGYLCIDKALMGVDLGLSPTDVVSKRSFPTSSLFSLLYYYRKIQHLESFELFLQL